jgi:hypothetical protein
MQDRVNRTSAALTRLASLLLVRTAAVTLDRDAAAFSVFTRGPVPALRVRCP